jgi:hypothetical protein
VVILSNVLTPQDMLKFTKNLEQEMLKAKKMTVAVGITADSATSKVYESGATVLQVASWHEFGRGNNPIRSFLRIPFDIKSKEINNFIEKQFSEVLEGKKDTEKALGLIGAFATNISKGAFTTMGYGTWAPLDPDTIDAKGSSTPLIDTGILRRAVNFEVRKK